jgi:hypothetical protein
VSAVQREQSEELFEVRWLDAGGSADLSANVEAERPLVCLLPTEASDVDPALIAAARRHADIVALGSRELLNECLNDLDNGGSGR